MKGNVCVLFFISTLFYFILSLSLSRGGREEGDGGEVEEGKKVSYRENE